MDARWLDIEHQTPSFRWSRALVLFCAVLAAMLLIGAVIAIAMAIRAPDWVVVAIPVGALAGFVVISAIHSRRGAIRAAHLAADSFDQDSPGAVRELANDRANRGGQAWPHFVRVALDRGLRDLTIRIGPIAAQPAAAPLDQPISPLPLNEADENFRALARAWLGEGAGLPKTDSADYLTRRWQRNIRMGGLGMTVLFGLFTLGHAWDSLQTGAPTPRLLLFSVSFLISLIGPMFAFSMAGGQLFVANGGLVRRRAVRRGGGWQVEVFRREDSVLVMHPVNPNVWRILLRNEAGSFKVLLTATECAMLLAAWRSPLPPPTAEALADLVE